VDCNDDSNTATLTSSLSVPVANGQTYYIQVAEWDDGDNGWGGTIALALTGSGTAGVSNDDPSSPLSISSIPYSGSMNTSGASAGANDPVHSCTGRADSATVWFRFVATLTGTVSVNANGSDYYTVLAAYPSSVSASTELACSASWTTSPRSAISFPVSQGQTYYIQASAWGLSNGGNLSLNATASGESASSYYFVPVTPCRVADTRTGEGFSGAFGPPTMNGGTTRTIPLTQSRCSIPAGAMAYSLNFTVVPRSALGYLATWPSGQARPLVSTLNSPSGKILANAAIVPAGSGGAIDVFVTDTTDVIVDINGYFAPRTTPNGLMFYRVTPCRISDTRDPAGPFGGPVMEGGATRSFTVPSAACNIPSSAQAFSLNATVVPDGNLGYLSLWPTGQSQPLVSTLNSPRGLITANAAIVPAGTNGAVSAYVTNRTHLILDINGYFGQ
jgi:hypothetical protein